MQRQQYGLVASLHPPRRKDMVAWCDDEGSYEDVELFIFHAIFLFSSNNLIMCVFKEY